MGDGRRVEEGGRGRGFLVRDQPQFLQAPLILVDRE